MKHTPGPWILEPESFVGEEYYEPCVVARENEHTGLSRVIAIVRIGLPETEANARLIKSAPLLLEALRGIIEIGKRDMSNPKYDEYFEAAKVALKEAEI